MTDDREIERARNLLEKAEKVVDPKLKADNFKEAFEALDSCMEDGVTESQHRVIENLRLAYARRILAQLDLFAVSPLEIWIGPVILLRDSLKREVDRLQDENPELKAKLTRFMESKLEEMREYLRQIKRL
jgi:hypothetical protein